MMRTRPRCCPPLLALVAALAPGAAACNNTPAAPHGAPVLLKVYWIAGGSRFTVWSPATAPDPMLATRVPAFASEVDFVFDRRLDGNRIEDTVTAGGVTSSHSKPNPPITARWPSFATVMSDPPLDLQVLYNSAGLYGNGSAFVFARPREPGFPAGTTVTFQLDRTNLASPYGEPLEMPDGVPVATQDFSVAIGASGGGDGGGATEVGTDFQLPLTFSNRPAALARVAPFVHARAGGVALATDLLVDARDATLLYLVPAACMQAWPPGAVIEVSVEAGLPDAFGVPLALAATAEFATGTGPRTASDACPAGQGGADAGATSDAPAAADGAADAAAADAVADDAG